MRLAITFCLLVTTRACDMGLCDVDEDLQSLSSPFSKGFEGRRHTDLLANRAAGHVTKLLLRVVSQQAALYSCTSALLLHHDKAAV